MADTPDIRPDETIGTITVGWGPGVTFRDSQRIELVTGEPADIIDEIGTWMSSGRLSPGWYTANAASQTLDGYESRFGLALVAANYQNAATIAQCPPNLLTPGGKPRRPSRHCLPKFRSSGSQT